MNYILPLIIGFGAAFLGMIQPGMLNMTAVKISLSKGKSEGLKFSVGAASVVIIQAFIAVVFAKYLVDNPEVINWLKKIAVFVLLALAISFFMQAGKEMKATGKDKKGNNYLVGFLMSLLNMLAIPFYLVAATWAESKGYFKIEPPYSYLYVIGAVFGSFSIFAIYAIFAKKIANKAQFIAKNINYILAVLFIVLALLTAYQVYL